ncbi:MAG TPA: FAD-dependent oxidoreductase [Gemmatimonadaceae bacterium]|nr:FAD-dependent oxidoreductase [Gemmatimonadaceae bacterium]
MSSDTTQLSGPDLTLGVGIDDVADGSMLLGHAGGESVLLARHGGEMFAISSTCTHYGGPLAEGLLVGDTVRCPWHHACFSLRTGAPIRPPALNDVPCWRVEQRDGKVFVTGKIEPPPARARQAATSAATARIPESIVILGAGAAGNSAAETLRREGFDGRVTVIDPDEGAPCDRPNLSKDYLAGNAPEDWIPLHPRSYYEEQRIELLLGRRATAIDARAKRVSLDDGSAHSFGALVIATGAEPVRLPISVGEGARMHYLRSLADSRSIIQSAGGSRRAVVLGASFIGLEVAASLRARDLEVHVVAPESRPLERVMGARLGDFIRSVHEEHGVHFHLGRTAREIAAESVTLDDGQRLAADMVVAGVGVRPNVALAEQLGLALDRGVLVNERLETSFPGIYAAGDLARWPDPHTGDRIRVEHWVVAERQGQAVARSILGDTSRFDAVPFFWSQHYDVVIAYVGHAERWDTEAVDGDPAVRDCRVSYRRGDRELAVATIFRDRESLEAELAMEARAARDAHHIALNSS